MKICLVGPFPPLRGGIAHYNAQLGLELMTRHEIAVISFSRQYPAILFPGRTQFDTGSPPVGLTSEAILDSINPLSWLRTGRRIAEIAPDLVIVHWWHPFFGLCLGTTVSLARRRSRASVIFICHNVVPHEPFPLASGLTRFALASGDAWLVHSETDRQDLESLNLRGHTLLVPQPPGQGFGAPIDKEEAKSRLGLSGNTLLFFGLIRSYKGLPGLLEAMPLVLQKVNCTLLVVGEFYEGKDRCLSLISDLGLASHVRVIDRFVPDNEVSLYFSAADLVVLPYESATQSAIVPIAFAFERPVVATRVGGLPEAVRDGETGLLVEPRNPTALAEAIIRFYEEDMGGIFRRHILKQQRFSWGELAATLETAAISRTSQ
ncbi:glycosyl transferase family 1 [Candidatus Methylomirabilis limnetica]|jgi:glycosyltransferase involved in cell wall biosynthesis|uniref:Glycosyl transferase family 1 n=1 Tax=Candidatus Methylomirabilis limnetica TaxID=2033718 RepID=A0A2T4TXN8_9BACT|nr:glycosyltransferase [Candidatus Methylomirabilis limnetica]PTL35882.1 glycosyl transferase family 1 [Candidatus Methylomirabilis limnetica]